MKKLLILSLALISVSAFAELKQIASVNVNKNDLNDTKKRAEGFVETKLILAGEALLGLKNFDEEKIKSLVVDCKDTKIISGFAVQDGFQCSIFSIENN